MRVKRVNFNMQYGVGVDVVSAIMLVCTRSFPKVQYEWGIGCGLCAPVPRGSGVPRKVCLPQEWWGSDILEMKGNALKHITALSPGDVVKPESYGYSCALDVRKVDEVLVDFVFGVLLFFGGVSEAFVSVDPTAIVKFFVSRLEFECSGNMLQWRFSVVSTQNVEMLRRVTDGNSLSTKRE